MNLDKAGVANGGWFVSKTNSTNKFGISFGNSLLNGWTYLNSQGNIVVQSNTWYHLAFVRNGTSLTLYVNGQADFQGTCSGTLGNSSAQTLYLGRNSFGNSSYCLMQDIRITKGIARYTSSFTPPNSIPPIIPFGMNITDDVLGEIWTNSEVIYMQSGRSF